MAFSLFHVCVCVCVDEHAHLCALPCRDQRAAYETQFSSLFYASTMWVPAIKIWSPDLGVPPSLGQVPFPSEPFLPASIGLVENISLEVYTQLQGQYQGMYGGNNPTHCCKQSLGCSVLCQTPEIAAEISLLRD